MGEIGDSAEGPDSSEGPDSAAPSRRPMGRPLQLNDIAAKKICDAISAGNTRRCAAACAGISHKTLQNWIAAGRHGDERFAHFLHQITTADGYAEALSVDRIRAGLPGWQGSAWWLERRRRFAWRRPIQETEKAPDLTNMPEEELLRAAGLKRVEK